MGLVHVSVLAAAVANAALWLRWAGAVEPWLAGLGAVRLMGFPVLGAAVTAGAFGLVPALLSAAGGRGPVGPWVSAVVLGTAAAWVVHVLVLTAGAFIQLP